MEKSGVGQRVANFVEWKMECRFVNKTKLPDVAGAH
jgi:hypothetical protein